MPRWFTYALSFSCACTSKHQWILGCVRSLQSIGVVRPMRRARARPCVRARAIAREGDRARYHSVTPLKAGAFQMFHCVYRVTERPRAPRIVPNRPRGCSLCLGAHGRFGLLVLQISATRREALCAPPWAVWDDPRLSGHLHGALRTLVVQDYDKRGPQSPKFILTDF